MSKLWNRFYAWTKIGMTRRQKRCLERRLGELAIVWLFVSAAVSIIRGQQFSLWDAANTLVATATALGHWFRLKPEYVVLQFMTFVLVFLAVVMLLMFIPKWL